MKGISYSCLLFCLQNFISQDVEIYRDEIIWARLYIKHWTTIEESQKQINDFKK
jgi:hypothetical protein